MPKRKELREHREHPLTDLEEISDVVTAAERARAGWSSPTPAGPNRPGSSNWWNTASRLPLTPGEIYQAWEATSQP
ncbi:hypothetical protein ACFRCW_40710 [Streptomyces sp. NPDC056653]|uniref:hypothetical protein n=1 Tax=Streptomyces sp. NPDC056653 TaxID=3345894 RepID=UPI0036AEF072